MTSSTERLISGLVEDLEPVRPLPRVRSAFAIILSVWAAALGLVLWSLDHQPGASFLLSDRVYLGSFIGLLVAALGATVSALAAGVPGRQRLELAGLMFALGGLGAAAIACLIGINAVGALLPPAPEGANGVCFRQSLFLSVLPAGVILSFLVRGWAAHPVRAAMVALLGSGALGALIIHLSCGLLDPRHMLMSHLSVPIVLLILGFYPLAVLMRRIRR